MSEYLRGIGRSAFNHSCFLSLVLLLFSLLTFFVSCTLSPEAEQEPPLQETKFYDRFTFDIVWAAALRAVDDLEYAIRKEIKESGFIYAQAKNNPDPRNLPGHLNVYIRDIDGRVRVNCHAIIPGQETDFKASHAIVKRFFTALAVRLKQ